MKIDKALTFNILAKHILKKMGVKDVQVDINNISTSISIMFTPHIPTLIKLGITDGEFFYIKELEDKVNQIFTYSPILNFPIGTGNIQITKADVTVFLEELKRNSVVEEVIYLPCQN